MHLATCQERWTMALHVLQLADSQGLETDTAPRRSARLKPIVFQDIHI